MARNLDLAARTENIREQRPAPTQFDLDQIKAHFDESISAVEKQYEISDELFSEGKLDEAKTILRSQIVLAEGVLDFLIHEISKYGLYHMISTASFHTCPLKKLKNQLWLMKSRRHLSRPMIFPLTTLLYLQIV